MPKSSARRAHDPERIYTPAVDETAGLGLFAGTVTPVLQMPGPGTEARRIAKADADRTLPDRQRKIKLALEGHGPMTRLALCEVTGLRENSVNSAVNAMLTAGLVRILPALDPATQRGVVALVGGER